MPTLIKRLVVFALLACPPPSLAADLRISREVLAHGEDLSGILYAAVEEIKGEFVGRGCERFTVAYWSDSVPLRRLNVEVTCRHSEANEALPVGAQGR